MVLSFVENLIERKYFYDHKCFRGNVQLLIPNSWQENLYINHTLRTTKSNYKVLFLESCITSQLVFFCDIPQTEI